MIESTQVRKSAAEHLLKNYGERDFVAVRGEGMRMWDAEGRENLDFLSGISVCSLGHCHPEVTAAISRQAAELVHCSNLYLIPQQVELAQRLCRLSFAGRAFFANSGAEVNEAAIKLARLWAKKGGGDVARFEIVTLRNSFHGRTMAMITATGQEKIQKGFEPLLEGFRYAHINDIDSVRDAVTERTCAIMLEPVQGEGGIVAATPDFLRAVRELCDERNLLLIFDEIQCGMGRTGTMFAYEQYGVAPDVMTLAKALGNGVPIGALLVREELVEVFHPGSHGTTFGGNPLACAAALAVLEVMERDDIPARAGRLGEYFQDRLRCEMKGFANVAEIRGIGLMVGIELTHEGAGVVGRCREAGLLINCTMGNVIRLLPPLIVTEEECERAAGILAAAIRSEGEQHRGHAGEREGAEVAAAGAVPEAAPAGIMD